jgi:diphthamide biosynthesis protein 7
VITGSYDDHIRIFAIQRLSLSFCARKARLLAEKNLGGGVWRLKLITVESNSVDSWSALVLASCMHSGSRVLRISGKQQPGSDWTWEIHVLGRFEEHQSMNYGSDFMPGTARPDSLVCVSTSFYDKMLCLWNLNTT